jgi:hypothetical protein
MAPHGYDILTPEAPAESLPTEVPTELKLSALKFME